MAKNDLTPSQVPTLDLTQSNVDRDSPVFQPMLSDLQANILKGHGRKFVYHIFLQLQGLEIVEAKQWIANFAETRITSALKFEEGRRAYKATGEDGGAVFTLSISATGYRALGFQDSQLANEQATPANSIVQDQPPGVDPPVVKDISAFRDGARMRAAKLGDGNVQVDREESLRKNVDVLIIVADDRPEKALQLPNKITSEVSTFSTVLLNQKGHVLHRSVALTESASGVLNIEHFGYLDGISQPLFYKDDIEVQASNRYWNDPEPLNLILVPDPHGRDFILLPNPTYVGWLSGSEANKLGASDELAATRSQARHELHEPQEEFNYDTSRSVKAQGPKLSRTASRIWEGPRSRPV
jgi:deferrochelatase/peroxidase EfeB